MKIPAESSSHPAEPSSDSAESSLDPAEIEILSDSVALELHSHAASQRSAVLRAIAGDLGVDAYGVQRDDAFEFLRGRGIDAVVGRRVDAIVELLDAANLDSQLQLDRVDSTQRLEADTLVFLCTMVGRFEASFQEAG